MTSLTDLFNKIDAYYKPQMEAEFSNISLSEIETIEFIAKTPYPNVTKLSHHLYMTRGAASKIAKNCSKISLNLIKFLKIKKEIYFRLTKEGQEINDRHESLHQKIAKKDQVIFDELTDESVSNILEFLNKYTNHLDSAIRNNIEK